MSHFTMLGDSHVQHSRSSQNQSDLEKLALHGEDPTNNHLTLAHAVLTKNILVLAWFIANGHNLDHVFHDYDKTALMLACEYPSLDSIYLLLQSGADINVKNSEHSTAVKLLITRALYNLQNHQELIVKILQTFVMVGLNINDHVDKLGNTALNLLCQQHELCGLNYTMAKVLIEADCDINLANSVGMTPLMSHALYGNESRYAIAELLLSYQVKTDLVDTNGNNALMYCAMNQDQASGFRIAKLIIEHNADCLTTVNHQGQNALELAAKFAHQRLVEYILVSSNKA